MRILLSGLVAALALVPGTALAQASLDGRVGRLESEMRAVQRKVFPNGAALEPQIQAPTATVTPDGVPATSAVADLTGRVSALEQQLASLTDQVEQAGFRTRTLQQAFDDYKRQTDARFAAMQGPAPIAPATTPGEPTSLEDSRPTPAPIARPVPRGEKPAPVAAKPVAGVARPTTGDTVEDEYLYGYRLWQAKQYPEAEAQLKKFVATYPKNRRASFAQNLLGRSYLDEGKPSLASMAFYDNYKKMPDGERAPESLYYLAQALMQLKKPGDACKVYGELTDVYGARISAGMKADVAKGRAAAKCD